MLAEGGHSRAAGETGDEGGPVVLHSFLLKYSIQELVGIQSGNYKQGISGFISEIHVIFVF